MIEIMSNCLCSAQSVDSALESWDGSGLDSNNATNGKMSTKTKHTDSHNDGTSCSTLYYSCWNDYYSFCYDTDN